MRMRETVMQTVLRSLALMAAFLLGVVPTMSIAGSAFREWPIDQLELFNDGPGPAPVGWCKAFGVDDKYLKANCIIQFVNKRHPHWTLINQCEPNQFHLSHPVN